MNVNNQVDEPESTPTRAKAIVIAFINEPINYCDSDKS